MGIRKFKGLVRDREIMVEEHHIVTEPTRGKMFARLVCASGDEERGYWVFRGEEAFPKERDASLVVLK